MAKSAKNRRRLSSRQFRSTPYPTSQPFCWDARKECNFKRTSALERNDWEESTCSVCMEFPHNAVLLLCSSHDKGCRPYMCGTSHRHSNCLEQFKKAYTKVTCTEYNSLGDNPRNSRWPLISNSEALELACPLCRGPVKGWTVVEPARKYLDEKKRSCMQDDCSFMGTYKELKKHVKSEHRCAKPREIDPEMEEKWRALELEGERQDVISTIMSSMPRSMVFGDYVIEMNNGSAVAGEEEDESGNEDPLMLNRNILYFLQEGARLMRLQWEGVDGVADAAAGRAVDVSRADRRNRRRRQRSRGPSPLDI
ncbi:hypothetical protein KFK09_021860 [Dendrobium nobile]|uniref:Uncharacterized protein n=1 Tax=Dendrobium nobile TaxID=94219 RepID=A0A8T3AH56_DENNO|nr:hypothetical protein KFK09_021860 [Dendrobium nobile]